jgi:hypothetical protein
MYGKCRYKERKQGRCLLVGTIQATQEAPFLRTPPPPPTLPQSAKQNDEVVINIPQSVEWPMYHSLKYHLLSLVQKIRKTLEAVTNPQIFPSLC